MYEENEQSLNWFKGCSYGCVYCIPSFQRQAKRQKRLCKKCYSYEPHAHLERLLKAPPKTKDGKFIFFPSSGELSFASFKELEQAIAYARKYFDRTFLMQAKNPKVFLEHDFPDNVLLGTTIETDKTSFLNNPSQYKHYWQISKAPLPFERVKAFVQVKHKRKVVIVEPILSFNHHILMAYIESIEPKIVYTGYDNHNCKLPEPSLQKTRQLIAELEIRVPKVRTKTLRKAWWEK